jgi:hypothetical protein
MDITYPNEYTPTALAMRDSWNAELASTEDRSFDAAFGFLSKRINDLLGLVANLELAERVSNGSVIGYADEAGHKFVRDPRRSDLEPLQVD